MSKAKPSYQIPLDGDEDDEEEAADLDIDNYGDDPMPMGAADTQ